jgi:transposase
MLLRIVIVGGLTLMMGQHTRSESLFYYFRLEDQVPENHLLRLVDKHINFGFVRERLKDSYSETGRPSIDPELLLRILLIGYLYGIISERKLVEELRMHLAWRWFTGLGFDQEVPNHSTFSKNRHGRFQESKVFEQLFEEVVAQCLSVGLVRGDQLSVDGTFVEANASKESRIPREQLAEAAQVNRTVREYLAELEIQNPVEEPTHNQDKVSTTDPDSTYATKGGTPARMGYYNNYLIDNHSCIVVGVQATGARLSEESRAAENMIARFQMARKKTAVYRCRRELWQWGVFTVADGPGDQAVHAHQGCYRTNEKSLVWSGVLYLLTREQQLHLPCRSATELRRTQREESHLRLHRNPQEVRPMRTEIPVHDRTVPVSCHPHERNSPAASAGSPNYTGVRTGAATAKEGRGALRRTKEPQPDRPPSAPAP